MTADSSGRLGGDRLAAWLIIPLTAFLTIVLIVFYGLFSTTTVEGDSMLPTLHPTDKLLVTKRYVDPVRDDVVVIRSSDGHGRVDDIVKRVVAVPGDTIEVRNDIAWLNGKKEPERALLLDPRRGVSLPAQRVPEGTVFVMGDNRPVSLDSRFMGFVRLSDVRGQAAAVFAPIQRIRAVH